MSKPTAKKLQRQLWETMQELRSGDITPKRANALARQARMLLYSVRIQMKIADMVRAELPKSARKFGGVDAAEEPPMPGQPTKEMNDGR